MFTTKKAEVVFAQIFSFNKYTLQPWEGLEHIYAYLLTMSHLQLQMTLFQWP